MAQKKLSTADILAAARAEAAKQKAAAAQPEAEQAAEVEGAAAPAEKPAEEKPAEPAAQPAQKPSGKPKSTADILAAARAGAGSRLAGPPGSTADILAAARAQAGGGAAAEKPAPAPKPAKASPITPAAKAQASGEKPSVQEMLKAVREGKPAVAEVESKPAAPRVPQKPAAAKKAEKQETRRNVLLAMVATPFALAWTAFGASCTAALLGTARFMFPNVLVEPPTKFKIGPLSDYPLGTVSTKWKATRGIWVVHTDQYKGKNLIYALTSVCTHLGCTPNWLEGEQKFKCPCHGSGFYITGVNFEGPAPRPLERAGISLAPDGMLEIDKSVKFQEEMGQWQEPTSFVDGTLA